MQNVGFLITQLTSNGYPGSEKQVLSIILVTKIVATTKLKILSLKKRIL